MGFHLVVAEAGNEGQAAWIIERVQPVNEAQHIVGFHGGATLHANRVAHATGKLDMSMVELARAVADPDHVPGGRVPGVGIIGRGVLAGHRLFIAKQQCFMAGVEVGFAQARILIGRDADGAHEIHGLRNPLSKLLIALALRAVGDKAEHPFLNILKVGISPDAKARTRFSVAADWR